MAASRRSSTSSTLLGPVAWSCFWSLASKDASRISMVVVGLLGLRVREKRFSYVSDSASQLSLYPLKSFSHMCFNSAKSFATQALSFAAVGPT